MPTTLTVPTVHLNGTSRKELVRALTEAHAAILEAQKKLAETAPHGRDYYVQSAYAITDAIEEHCERMKKLQDVKVELEQIAEALFE